MRCSVQARDATSRRLVSRSRRLVGRSCRRLVGRSRRLVGRGGGLARRGRSWRTGSDVAPSSGVGSGSDVARPIAVSARGGTRGFSPCPVVMGLEERVLDSLFLCLELRHLVLHELITVLKQVFFIVSGYRPTRAHQRKRPECSPGSRGSGQSRHSRRTSTAPCCCCRPGSEIAHKDQRLLVYVRCSEAGLWSACMVEGDDLYTTNRGLAAISSRCNSPSQHSYDCSTPFSTPTPRTEDCFSPQQTCWQAQA